MRLVVIESPFAGDVQNNVEYAKRCMLDCLKRGEAPYASHLLYPQVLDDLDPEERNLGITAGLEWADKAELRAVYCDRGVSHGMKIGVAHAKKIGQRIVLRSIEGRDVSDFEHLFVDAAIQDQ